MPKYRIEQTRGASGFHILEVEENGRTVEYIPQRCSIINLGYKLTGLICNNGTFNSLEEAVEGYNNKGQYPIADIEEIKAGMALCILGE